MTTDRVPFTRVGEQGPEPLGDLAQLIGSTPRPSPLAVWRHCPDPDCGCSWRSTAECCWACGRRGQSGQLTNKQGRPYETYTGGAPTPENPFTA